MENVTLQHCTKGNISSGTVAMQLKWKYWKFTVGKWNQTTFCMMPTNYNFLMILWVKATQILHESC